MEGFVFSIFVAEAGVTDYAIAPSYHMKLPTFEGIFFILHRAVILTYV